MDLLKEAELLTYVKRVEVPDGDEAAWIRIASIAASAYCRMFLDIRDYTKSIELGPNGVGRIYERPIHNFAQFETETGFRVRPIFRAINGGRITSSVWQDITLPANIEELVDKKTGKISIQTFGYYDFNRAINGGSIEFGAPTAGATIVGYDAQVEFYAGHFINTTLAADADSGATEIEVELPLGFVKNRTRLYIAYDADADTPITQEYRVTNVSGSTVTISPGLVAAATSGAVVESVIPEEVKAACGAIIEDKLTYEPNTVRMHSRLDVLTDILWRSSANPVPIEAAYYLENYRLI